jgi:hypothetical protein
MYPNLPFLLGSTTLDAKLSVRNGFLLELMGSFFFYFVISQTALDERGIAKSRFPAIPIGFSLVVVHICLIPFTGCGVNPARTFGPAVMTCMVANEDECKAAIGDFWWIYFVGPFLAAVMVVEVSSLMHWDVEGVAAIADSSTIQAVDDKKNKYNHVATGSREEDYDCDEDAEEADNDVELQRAMIQSSNDAYLVHAPEDGMALINKSPNRNSSCMQGEEQGGHQL